MQCDTLLPSPEENVEAVVVLNDRGGTITVDRSGNLAGLDEVAVPMRNEIAKVLLSERIEQPTILKDLQREEGNLRGSNDKEGFNLISPTRTVILSDRPVFKWDKLSGASTYRVFMLTTLAARQ